MENIRSPEYARRQDEADPLAGFRDRFVITDPDLIYLDGNSLGRLPKASRPLLDEHVDQLWADRLIRSWPSHWWKKIQVRIGDKIAGLIGASEGETIIADSTSNNLFKLAIAALKLRPGRTKIVTDDLNFPSDLYILQGVCKLMGPGYHIEVVRSENEIFGPVEALEAAIDQDTALVTLTHTVFKSAYIYPMDRLTAAAHRAGALTLWDLSHSVGSVPVALNQAGADLAVGCTYKYLNGGPGAPAFLYVRKDLQAEIENPVSGWMGQDNPFDFAPDYSPAEGMRRWLTGTPSILSIVPIETGVDLLLEAGMEQLRAKSQAQTDYLYRLWEQELKPLGYEMKSPADREQRGSHISLGHPMGLGISQALINEENVLPDFRPPDNIRLGIAPLYVRFEEIRSAVERLARVVKERSYEKYMGGRPEVT